MRKTPDDSQLPSGTTLDRQVLLLTVRQVAELTGISRSKLYEFFDSKELRTVYVGSSRRVKPSDLQKFLDGLGDEPDIGDEF